MLQSLFDAEGCDEDIQGCQTVNACCCPGESLMSVAYCKDGLICGYGGACYAEEKKEEVSK